MAHVSLHAVGNPLRSPQSRNADHSLTKPLTSGVTPNPVRTTTTATPLNPPTNDPCSTHPAIVTMGLCGLSSDNKTTAGTYIPSVYFQERLTIRQ